MRTDLLSSTKHSDLTQFQKAFCEIKIIFAINQFPKLRGCHYERIEEMKEAETKVIDTLTQEDFHEAFQKMLERYNKWIAAGGDYFEGN